ncbi:MAG: hypothetical protein ISS65_06990 [Desulfobacterales bacterium]|uniref:Uncharacterized protein n=1 Tax=Candidatus Desulfatibia profunda TaxID=2841695 RepID=A0A8J6NK67_9BACT|nr:hypothetical protein [Candidatus Desulfatibia profunda]MBL7179941.1 hypothetical protein [Desulfobacterales bacterium]
MDDKAPAIRKDLEFIPVQQGNQQLILIRDHLGLVREGMGVAPHLFQIMALLDGTKTIRDLQMELMRQRGGVIVGADEVSDLLKKLDDAFMLDSEKFNKAKYQIEAERFWEESIRVEDRFNVCGFPAMAAMLEVLPACHGEIINHRYHHERPTQSAVSFAAVVFVAQN